MLFCIYNSPYKRHREKISFRILNERAFYRCYEIRDKFSNRLNNICEQYILAFGRLKTIEL